MTIGWNEFRPRLAESQGVDILSRQDSTGDIPLAVPICPPSPHLGTSRMRSRGSSRIPHHAEELLEIMRRCRVLPGVKLRELRRQLPPGESPGRIVDQLVHQGLLTPYQGQCLLAGRPGRLRLGPYQILEPLGHGGMGSVFKARHRLLGRVVALKILGRRRSTSGRATQSEASPRSTQSQKKQNSRSTQLRREIHTTGLLSHPNIVGAHDACLIRDRLVLVLEYVAGIDLDRLVTRTGPLPEVLTVDVMRQATLALDHLHAQGLVHRDVKPANLMLGEPAPGEPGPVVKLLDLGIACPASLADGEYSGTPDYFAPERGESGRVGDPRSDLYSLGCTFYHLLAGQVPYPGGGWTSKLLRHRLEQPVSIRQIRPDLSPECAAIVERLMARNPDLRYASARQLLEALQSLRPTVARAVPAIATPVAPAPAPVAPARRPRRKPVLASLAVMAVGMGIFAGSLLRQALASAASQSREAVPVSLTHSVPGVRPTPPPAAKPLALASLIELAQPGEAIDIPDGRHVVHSLRIRGKNLTLRAAPGAHPVLVCGGGGGCWEPLLRCEGPLTLENLEFQGGEEKASPAPLVAVENGTFQATNCRFTQRGEAAAVCLRGCDKISLRKCSIHAPKQGLAIQPSDRTAAKVDLANCRLHVSDTAGVAVLVWARETDPARPVDLHLQHSKIRAGRVLALRSLQGSVEVRGADNHFIFYKSLVSLDGYRKPDEWQNRLAWRCTNNHHEGNGPWIQVDGRPRPIWNEQGLSRVWSHQP